LHIRYLTRIFTIVCFESIRTDYLSQEDFILIKLYNSILKQSRRREI